MAEGFLTTHVLDTALGVPAEGLRITLDRLDGDRRERLAEMVTNADGRTDGPILPRERFAPGLYELTFRAGDYLQGSGAALTRPPFLDEVPIRFGMEAGHYHVPLLLSPFGYSTYRGS
ncbi:transthyretin family protein [Rubellimicrobium mesophilum DSM 19309]|uniref:5-hydroxyisourate hydrolase n=1 Tax=Rubellimicrobium mesophilum DSM 19309 TaxID=442562 RepID=A0A017HUZ8_9RHOB|nr:hydroxyisourate hydrolase [Rubellimicrobium mesophilum]EYD78145.1 transthyretin family protein [Rubellimicrobium mesophilum DSM 19309]